MDRTLMIIKPDAVQRGYIGAIVSRAEQEGFEIQALRLALLGKGRIADFYAEHKERPFYQSLVSFMSSGPVVLGALCAPEAVKKWRSLIGSTDPADAAANTIRKLYAQNKERNAVHGSDSEESAKRELAFFFQDKELLSPNASS